MIKPSPFDLVPPDASPNEIRRALNQQSVPIVEDSRVTFVYFGPAEKVELRHWIYGLPASIPLSRLGHTDLWYCAVEFPFGSRIEYKFGVVSNDHETWIHDPLNANIANDPFGGNSVVHCSGYEVPEWSQPVATSPPGQLLDLPYDSKAFGDQRVIRVYLPANYRDYRRYRLLVVHDGDDYILYSQFRSVLDNLIARLEIPPLVVAFTNPHERIREYTNDPRHSQHLVEEVIPLMNSRYSLIAEPAGRCLMGASLGGVASLSTAWTYPEAFGSLLLQSGSFAFTDIGEHTRSPVFDPVVEFMNAFRQAPGVPAKRIFLSCGVYESLIYENRSLAPFLQARGVDVKFVEAFDGHNWQNWRDRLRAGLTWLFPGPLWVTYL